MSETDTPASKPSGFWASAAGVLGTFLIFLIILAIVYIPGHTAPAPQQPEDGPPKTPEARKAKLEEVVSAASKDYASYGVIDANARTVRLPVERAMELVIAEKGAK